MDQSFVDLVSPQQPALASNAKRKRRYSGNGSDDNESNCEERVVLIDEDVDVIVVQNEEEDGNKHDTFRISTSVSASHTYSTSSSQQTSDDFLYIPVFSSTFSTRKSKSSITSNGEFLTSSQDSNQSISSLIAIDSSSASSLSPSSLGDKSDHQFIDKPSKRRRILDSESDTETEAEAITSRPISRSKPLSSSSSHINPAKLRKVCKDLARGKFARKEMVIIMDPAFANDNDVGKSIKISLEAEDFEIISSEKYRTNGLIVFQRRKLSIGNMNQVTGSPGIRSSNDKDNEIEYEEEDFRMLVWSGDIFLSHLVEPLYDSLVTTLNKISDNRTKRLIIILQNPSEAVKKVHLRRRSQESRSTMSQFDANDIRINYQYQTMDGIKDAILWLYFTYGYEVSMSSSAEETIRLVSQFARKLAFSPYRSELDTIKVIKKFRIHQSDDMDGNNDSTQVDSSLAQSNKDHVNHQVWINMLRCIPMLGQIKANKLAEAFPTISSLVQFYSSHSAQVCDEKIASLLGETRKQIKLAKTIRLIYTEYNQELIIKD